MNQPCQRASQALMLAALFVCTVTPASFAAKKDKVTVPTMRWDANTPGCTFSRDSDGKYRYGIWYGDVGIIMAVDSQELEKVHRRHEPFFAILLTVKDRGPSPFDFAVDQISLEFVKHFRVRQLALNPDDFSAKVQSDADTLNDQTAREVGKHPEEKGKKEDYVKAFLKDSTELQEFVGKNSLRATRLGPGSSEATGWLLFSTNSKWISGWKKQEEFILRIPLDGKVFEFPFKLPPKPGETILRKRE